VPVSCFYASRYRHTDLKGWRQRLADGEIHRNGDQLLVDAPLRTGDRLAWHRPPWQEPSVPATWQVMFDDGDLYVIDKPSGLPVLPAGGFLEHTVLRMLERRFPSGPVPRPVHRLGRFTSGLLVCARKPATRAWLSAQLRGSTTRTSTGTAGTHHAEDDFRPQGIRKTYLALLVPGAVARAIGERITITTPIGLRPHPLLGSIWSAVVEHSGADHGRSPAPLSARSQITLLSHRADGDLVAVGIATGRPHQIRIHCAALGAPLLGDPLYLPGGQARVHVLPGEGGYHLHAYTMCITGMGGEILELKAPPSNELLHQ
jgi:23S rRNA pseudouridine1911/1915/1917 synthase